MIVCNVCIHFTSSTCKAQRQGMFTSVTRPEGPAVALWRHRTASGEGATCPGRAPQARSARILVSQWHTYSNHAGGGGLGGPCSRCAPRQGQPGGCCRLRPGRSIVELVVGCGSSQRLQLRQAAVTCGAGLLADRCGPNSISELHGANLGMVGSVASPSTCAAVAAAAAAAEREPGAARSPHGPVTCERLLPPPLQ